MSVAAAVMITQQLTQIGESINNVVDVNKRRNYEQKLTLLSINEREALNKALKQQQSEEAKQKLLADVLGTMNRDRIDAMVRTQNEREKTIRYLYIFGGVAILTLIGIYVYIAKKGKQ
jgi:hypothetical protein